ncbi:hypothetical protein PSAB6_50053 [Paraburkholderia sabiae]|nr:hypothetical protein PSAB6_50053 [Paraburkholderia sabiae]
MPLKSSAYSRCSRAMKEGLSKDASKKLGLKEFIAESGF